MEFKIKTFIRVRPDLFEDSRSANCIEIKPESKSITLKDINKYHPDSTFSFQKIFREEKQVNTK